LAAEEHHRLRIRVLLGDSLDLLGFVKDLPHFVRQLLQARQDFEPFCRAQMADAA
jgi:hypothetical protein